MPVHPLTDAAFDADVLRAAVPVLVDIGAAWCAPCKALEPVLHRLADTLGDQVRIVSLDADANPDTVARFAVRALPTLLLFDRGVLVERWAGVPASGALLARLNAQLTLRAAGAEPTPLAAAVSSPAPSPASSPAVAEAEALLASPAPLVVFKHSVTCSISIGVKRQFDAFVAAHPTVATRVVIVQSERPLSNALEAVTGVRHESPQALVVRDGRVRWSASHHRITAAALEQAVLAAPVEP